MRALIVEDEPAIAELIKHLLTKAGFEVAVATSVSDALEKIARLKPALITLDLLLPDGSGYDVLLELRGKSYGKNMMVLVISVLTNKKAEFGKLLKLTQGYLTKPFSIKDFQHTLQEVLGEKQFVDT